MRRLLRGAGWMALGVSALGAACAGGRAEPRPVASLAHTPPAAEAFDAIREAWAHPDDYPPSLARGMLENFLTRFPWDGMVPMARGALALVALDLGDVAAADMQIALTDSVPPGTAQDIRTVARARRARLGNDAETALALLRPLVGKTVDPIVRSAFEEDLSLAALATHRDYEAISYMDAWLRAMSADEKAEAVKTVTSLVERIPQDVLVGALRAMRAQRASFGYGVDIQRILAQRLAQIATLSGNAELARQLLDPDAGAVVVSGDAAASLEDLATSRRGLNVVEGRTIGLLLPTESPALRDEAADVLRGVMWALGLPRGSRDRSVAPAAPPDAGASAVTRPCAPPEPAAFDEPQADEALRLVTRDDAGSADRTEVSLDELSGEGAAVVLAGLDPQTAGRALRWGAGAGIPVITLVPPETASPSPFAFGVGQARADVVAALARAAPALGSQPVAPVVDASEVPAYPAQGGRVAGLSLMPPVSCDIPAARAGEPRFPIAQWAHDQARAWLVSGSSECAGDVVAELSTARLRGTVALTLEAAALPSHAAALRVLSAQAGVVPEVAHGDPREEEVRRLAATLGRVGWWTALGRDAATLARLAVRQLPADEVSEPRLVTQRRADARDRLSAARAPLWTTESTGWSEGHVLQRSLCVVEAR